MAFLIDGKTITGPFSRFPTRVWENAHLNNVTRVMVCDMYFSFPKLINFIKRIYILFLKNVRPLLFYLPYKLVQLFVTFNRTDVSFFKQVNKKYGKRIALIFHLVYKAQRKSKSLFSRSFLAVFSSSVMQLISSISLYIVWTGLFWKKLQIYPLNTCKLDWEENLLISM